LSVEQSVRQVGLDTMECALNGFEPTLEDMPSRLSICGQIYHRRPGQHPNTIGTLFGQIQLLRHSYDPREPGERFIHPLEIRLGIEAGLATPALAERVGWYTTDHSEGTVLELLRRDHSVKLSKDSLRKLTASLSDGMSSHRHEAQVRKVLEMLKQAANSRGRGSPVLGVGRDGVNVPMRGGVYKEGGVGTISVFDRRGKRLGTVYLACMPESGQGTLTDQLTRLIRDVLSRWEGALPRLAYITDEGYHQHQYYRRVLRRMENPRRPGTYLHWERVVDYFHACQYISTLQEVLYGSTKAGRRWGHRMRQLLKNTANGIVNVLKSAAALRHRLKLNKKQQKQYHNAYRYLCNRRQWMQYHTYRRQGVPIGSGVTEAACKTIFTQRMRRSGMSWGLEGGQVVLNLRIVLLSGLWRQVHTAYLASKVMPQTVTNTLSDLDILQNAA